MLLSEIEDSRAFTVVGWSLEQPARQPSPADHPSENAKQDGEDTGEEEVDEASAGHNDASSVALAGVVALLEDVAADPTEPMQALALRATGAMARMLGAQRPQQMQGDNEESVGALFALLYKLAEGTAVTPLQLAALPALLSLVLAWAGVPTLMISLQAESCLFLLQIPRSW